MRLINQIVSLFQEHGSDAYFGEGVSETEHALQSAHQAEQSGAPAELVAAALLHDVGHLLHGLPEDIGEKGVDAKHEDVGSRWLQRHFGPRLVDAVGLHVAAKRYLCAVEAGYFDGLSEASRRSLMLQGGPMSADEVRAFEALPGFQWSVDLRRWDDAAKVPGLAVPGLEHYRPHLEAALSERNNG